MSMSLERLTANSRAKAPVQITLLRQLIALAVAGLPFDEDFYMSQYADIREAAAAGELADLKSHFVNQGYFENRFGSKPNLDEEFYRQNYPDVDKAISDGSIGSGLEHYMRSGALEGRLANRDQFSSVNHWRKLLGLN